MKVTIISITGLSRLQKQNLINWKSAVTLHRPLAMLADYDSGGHDQVFYV